MNECINHFCFLNTLIMPLIPSLHAQAKRKKKEEAANARILEAEKRNKASKRDLRANSVFVTVASGLTFP